MLLYFTYLLGFAAFFFGTLAVQDRQRRPLSVEAAQSFMLVNMPLQSGQYRVPWVDVTDIEPDRRDGRVWLSFCVRDDKGSTESVLLTGEQWALVRNHLAVLGIACLV